VRFQIGNELHTMIRASSISRAPIADIGLKSLADSLPENELLIRMEVASSGRIFSRTT
jgi:hypothetical protein